jgi:hypothetical protein
LILSHIIDKSLMPKEILIKNQVDTPFFPYHQQHHHIFFKSLSSHQQSTILFIRRHSRQNKRYRCERKRERISHKENYCMLEVYCVLSNVALWAFHLVDGTIINLWAVFLFTRKSSLFLLNFFKTYMNNASKNIIREKYFNEKCIKVFYHNLSTTKLSFL